MRRARGAWRLAIALPIAAGSTSCFQHAETPAEPSLEAALLGASPLDFNRANACGHWAAATDDETAKSHAAFPELEPSSCFVRVRYDGDAPRADPTPEGCAYGATDLTKARLDASAARYEAIARGDRSLGWPTELACDLDEDVRRAAARHDAIVVRHLEARLEHGATFPYSAAAAFGYGHPVHANSDLVHFLPDDLCPELTKKQIDELSVNVVRAARAAEAVAAGIAPIMIASGGAIHSKTVESFALLWIASCRLGLRRDRVLVDPCADHTHTNVRNTGSIVVEIGGRTAYLVTDDGLQSAYLQEWTSFDVIGGSIDQRALRDFGYLLGSYRQASVGMDAGFWYTPYRFFARGDPLFDFTCLGE